MIAATLQTQRLRACLQEANAAPQANPKQSKQLKKRKEVKDLAGSLRKKTKQGEQKLA